MSHMLIEDQFGIIQNLLMSPIPKTSQDQFLGLDFSYSKTTLYMYEGPHITRFLELLEIP